MVAVFVVFTNIVVFRIFAVYMGGVPITGSVTILACDVFTKAVVDIMRGGTCVKKL